MRESIFSKFNEETLEPEAPSGGARATRSMTRSSFSSVDSMETFGMDDIAALRKQITTYEHREEDFKFLSEVLERVLPIARLPPVLFSMAIEAHRRMTADAGQRVVDAGTKADRFFVVASGTWRLTAPEVNRGRTVLGTYHAGGIIAERVLYRAVAKTNLGKLPFAVECISAGEIYALPIDAFVTIMGHVSSGAALGLDNTTEFLESIAACADAPHEAVEALAAKVKVRSKKAGQAILTKSTSAVPAGVLVVRSGTLKLTLPTDKHRAANVSGEAPSVTFTTGDVRLVSSADVSYLQLDEADTSLMPERMAWVAEHLTYFKLMKSMEVFRGLSSDQVEVLVRAGTLVTALPGEKVSVSSASAEAGEAGKGLDKHLSLIMSGRVSVARQSKEDPSKSERMGVLGVAEHFGALNIVDPTAKRQTDVTAETPLTLLALDAASFGSLLPLVQHHLARELANRRWILENRNKVKMHELDAIRTIGVGTFGRVKLCIHKPTGRPYALKILKKRMLMRLNQVTNVRSEHALLSTCNHPFLLKLAAAFQDADSLYLILEFVQGGEVYRQLYDGPLPLERARYYAANVVAAFSYLAGLDVVYRDLKPENLLLAANGQLRIVDFGFAKMLPDGKAFTFCGTPDYMAPEMICHAGYGLTVDWWSLGVLLWELLVCEVPFMPLDHEDIDTFGKVLEYASGRSRLRFPRGFDPAAKDLVSHLLQPDPADRYTASETMAHAFFDGIDFMALEDGHIAPPYVPTISNAADASNFDKFDEEDAPQRSNAHEPPLPEPSVFGAFVEIGDEPPAEQKAPLRKATPRGGGGGGAEAADSKVPQAAAGPPPPAGAKSSACVIL